MKTFEETLVHHTPKTRKEMLNHVNYLKQWAEEEKKEINQLSYEDILQYVTYEKTKVKKSTIELRLRSISKYYNHLKETGERTNNPVTGIKLKNNHQPIKTYLTGEELETIYQNYPKENLQYKVILGLMIYQAADSAVLKQITPKDINLDKGEIYLAGSQRSNPRTQTLQSGQLLPLLRYLQTLEPEEKLVKGRLSDRMMLLLKKLPIKSIRQLRQSRIALWVKQTNLREAQYLAGHKNICSTEAYKQQDFEGLQKELADYHPF